MRSGPKLLAALALSACGGDAASRPVMQRPALVPAVEAPATSTATAWLWVMVVDHSGVCVPKAVIVVVRGQDSGQVVTPSADCDAWSYDGGHMFRDLAPNVPMTIRASAPAYSTEEKTIVPVTGPQQSTLFVLARTPM